MIIDTHSHVCDEHWPPEGKRGLSNTEFVEAMDIYGVNKAWILPATGLVKDFKAGNDTVYEFTKKYPDRLERFFTVSPIYSELVVDEIKRCVEVMGFKGIKLHPWLQSFSVTFNIVNRIIEESIKYNLPVLFHDGTPPFSDSLQIANLAELYPEAKIILGHSGLHDLYRSAIAAAKRHKNIYLCICANSIGDTRQIVKEVDNSRILFGSDFGRASLNILKERIEIIEYAVEKQEQKDRIFFKNAENLIK
jgi:predicted TIM-barrel fold metal-dependent hydrolase